MINNNSEIFFYVRIAGIKNSNQEFLNKKIDESGLSQERTVFHFHCI